MNAEAILARMEQRVQTPCTRTLVAVSLVTRGRTARQVRFDNDIDCLPHAAHLNNNNIFFYIA